MLVVPINEAEAIIEPYWDGGTVDHVTPKRCLLEEYRVSVPPSAAATVKQTWSGVRISIEKALPGEAAVVMERKCDISIEDYDIFRVFAPIPQWAVLTATAVIDGEEQTLLDHVQGKGVNDEYDGALRGKHLTYLRLQFAVSEEKSAGIDLFWLGLSNREAQERMEARKSPYNAEWKGFLNDEIENFTPEIGIFFDGDELEGIREKVTHGHLQEAFRQIREKALEDMKLNPEAEVGEFVPTEDRRWCRNRDVKRVCTAGKMERLAFVGMVDKNREMCRMAARMALAAAHNRYWCESVMGTMPGTTWHHASFTEEVYSRACALVLDWAGFCFTPHGKQFLRDAIVIKGLSRIESDFKRAEYLRAMNQGIVFSSGRIMALLALSHTFPRYKSLLEEAEKDLYEMADTYVLEDGGILEGPHYWDYTFEHVLPLVYALARYHGKPFEEYASDTIKKVGDYPLGILSTVGDGTAYLALNDSLMEETIAPSLMAAYSRISDRAEWKSLYRAMIKSGSSRHDLYHILLSPERVEEAGPVIQPKFLLLPKTGEVSSVRRDPQLGFVHFHMSSGPVPSLGAHCHGDKGSFILEAAGEHLAVDAGRPHYGSSEGAFVHYANRHNLLCPENHDGSVIHQNTRPGGGRIASAAEEDGVLLLCSDQLYAWPEGLFKTCLRRVVSPWPDLYLLEDWMEMDHPKAMSFRLNSLHSMKPEKDSIEIAARRTRLRVTPLNWRPAKKELSVQGTTCHSEPVHHLKMLTACSAAHRMLTVLQVLPVGGETQDCWKINRGEMFSLSRGSREVHLDISLKDETTVVLKEQGRVLVSAVCRKDQWRFVR